MTDEELRLRCLELATALEGPASEMFECAEGFFKWVTKDRYPTKTPDKIHFEKINPERS